METMTDHHGFVVVGGWRRPKGHGSGFEDLLLFSFQGSDSRETGCLFFERKELLDGGVAQLEEHQARVSGWSSGLDSRWDTTSPKLWGCSSAGRAPALQAGGHGFDSHHLHHFLKPGVPGFKKCKGMSRTEPRISGRVCRTRESKTIAKSEGLRVFGF